MESITRGMLSIKMVDGHSKNNNNWSLAGRLPSRACIINHLVANREEMTIVNTKATNRHESLGERARVWKKWHNNETIPATAMLNDPDFILR